MRYVVGRLAVVGMLQILVACSMTRVLPEPHRDMCEEGRRPKQLLLVRQGNHVGVIAVRGKVSTEQYGHNPRICHRGPQTSKLESIVIDGRCDFYSPPPTVEEAWIATFLKVTVSCDFPSGPLEVTLALRPADRTMINLGDCREKERVNPILFTPLPASPVRKPDEL